MSSMADQGQGPEPNDKDIAQPAGEAATVGQAQAAQPAELAAGSHHEIEERLVAALAEAAEFKDQFLRAKAETENLRRRAQEDVARAHKFAIEAFAEALLPVKDSLELALKSDSPQVESMREGVDATLRLLASAFEKNRLLEVDPAGQRFDPNLHQAISMVPGNSVDPAVPANHVVGVLQKGYTINDRVLRPALVTVSQG